MAPQSWRGWDGEDDMTDEDWEQRAGEQARAMLHACDPFLSSPDEDGHPTGGQYNSDYSDEYHEALNRQLDEDEYFEAEQTERMNVVFHFKDEGL